MPTPAVVKAQIRATIPPGWRYRATITDHVARVVIQSAPHDLLAIDAELTGRPQQTSEYAQVVPSAYERAQDGPAAVIRQVLAALHAGNTVQFDARGDRIGSWRAVEVWVGHWRRPYVVAV